MIRVRAHGGQAGVARLLRLSHGVRAGGGVPLHLPVPDVPEHVRGERRVHAPALRPAAGALRGVHSRRPPCAASRRSAAVARWSGCWRTRWARLEVVVGKFLGDWAVRAPGAGRHAAHGAGRAHGLRRRPRDRVGPVHRRRAPGGAARGVGPVGIELHPQPDHRVHRGGRVSSFVLFLIGLQVVQIGLPPLFSGALAHLSVVSHFQNVARGVIDLRDVLYFVSTGALFLVLATGTVARDRLSRGGADYKRLRVGAGVVAVLVVVLNLLGSHVRGRLDLTRDNLYTLADGYAKRAGRPQRPGAGEALRVQGAPAGGAAPAARRARPAVGHEARRQRQARGHRGGPRRRPGRQERGELLRHRAHRVQRAPQTRSSR